ncbi:SIS domain-containing protein [Rickettsiella endosymbiont of Miltochrista miniata]|uniref:SIS domain-containing protein n=1 Tax=Rickettsiella endosymbiont of Miltochrista miniata TaxID=3066239 RepID=UPI00313E5478
MFSEKFLIETKQIIDRLDLVCIEKIVNLLLEIQQRKGRLFFLGVGGSAANASHAVNDFRKIVGIESYTPTDNIAELTARANDDGWKSVFSNWLAASHLSAKDMLFVLSVGGGDIEKNISPNLVAALDYGKEQGAKIVGILGRDGGYTAKLADAYVLIPTVNVDHITPHAEAFQAVIWHLMVAHPKLKTMTTKWESVMA